MPGVIDVKILCAPALDVIEVTRRIDIPQRRGVRGIAHLDSIKPAHYKKLRAECNKHHLNLYAPPVASQRDESGSCSTKTQHFLGWTRRACGGRAIRAVVDSRARTAVAKGCGQAGVPLGSRRVLEKARSKTSASKKLESGRTTRAVRCGFGARSAGD